jgi:hypothetical protein
MRVFQRIRNRGHEFVVLKDFWGCLCGWIILFDSEDFVMDFRINR